MLSDEPSFVNSIVQRVWRFILQCLERPQLVGMGQAIQDGSSTNRLQAMPHQFDSGRGGRVHGQQGLSRFCERNWAEFPSLSVAERGIIPVNTEEKLTKSVGRLLKRNEKIARSARRSRTRD